MDQPPPLLTMDPAREAHRVSAPDRTCGDCTVCCVHLNVDTPELRKPKDVPCEHLTARGCGVYETRPPICRTWYCLWRDSSLLAESIRPDLSGVLFTRQTNEKDVLGPAYFAAKALRSPDDFQQPEVKRALARLVLARVLPVWLSYKDKRHRLFPDAELTDAIFNPRTTEFQHLLPLAAELRSKWGITAG